MAFLEVPFLFSRTGFVARARNEGTQVLSAKTIIRLPELSGAEAPIVARCSYDGFVPGRGENGQMTWTASPVEVDYRRVDGRLVRRAVPDDMFLIGGSVTAAWLNKPEFRAATDVWMRDSSKVGIAEAQVAMDMVRFGLNAGAFPPVLNVPWKRGLNAWAAVPEENQNFARRTGDDKLARARAAQRTLTGVACLVDGALYMPSMGPGWVLTTVPPNMGPNQAHAVPEFGWLDRGDLGAAFAPGDIETCRTFGGQPTCFGHVEVFDPDALDIHPDEMSARTVAANVCNADTAKTFARKGSPIGLRAMADVMELAASAAPCGDRLPEVLSALADAWEAAIVAGDPLRHAADEMRGPAKRARIRAEAAMAGPHP